MAKQDRYRKKDSDRSGFTYLRRQLVRDNGHLVGPDEFDTPPPSNESLGGEGEISHGDTRANAGTLSSIATPNDKKLTVQYITAAGGISSSKRAVYASGEVIPNQIIQVAGSNQTIDISADPQISSGAQSDKITLECVGSNVILQDGNGLDLREQFNMDSGALITLMYDSGNTVWRETSRSHRTKTLGAF